MLSSTQIGPSTGQTNRRPLKQAESQSTHLEKGENEHQASPPASMVKRCSRASRLHSPELPATPVDSTRDTDVSDVESLCSVLSDMETPLTRSKQRAKLAFKVYHGDEELSGVESCSSAISASSPGRKTRQSVRRKTISRSSNAVQGAVKMESVQDSCSSTVSTSSRVTRSQRKAAPNRLPTKHTDDSELSDPDSWLSSISGADVPNSSTCRAMRPRRQTGPIPTSIHKAGDCTSLTPVRQSSRVAARRKTPVAVEVSAPQSCDSEGFESGPTCSRENRRRRVAKILDSDSDFTDFQSPDSSSCSKGSSSHKSSRNKSPETPVVSRLSVKNVGVIEKSVEPAEDTSLRDSRLENTLIAEDAECTLLEEEIEQGPNSDKVDMTEETKVSEQFSHSVEDAVEAARDQQEELCQENQKADTLEREEMQEKAARVTDIDPLQGDKDDDATVDPQLCEEEEEMEAGPVDSDNQQVVECFQVTSSQEHNIKVDSISEDEPEVITIYKKEVMSLLDSSEDEEKDEEEEEDEEREVSETEEKGVSSSKPGAADMAVDGLFMIDTRPGQEADGQYYIEEVRQEKKASEDYAEHEEEEEFVDEEVNDDHDDTDLLYSSRNPLL